MPSPRVLTLEQYLASTHQSLWKAVREASSLADLSLHDELQMILIEVERLIEDLMRPRGLSEFRRSRQYVTTTGS